MLAACRFTALLLAAVLETLLLDFLTCCCGTQNARGCEALCCFTAALLLLYCCFTAVTSALDALLLYAHTRVLMLGARVQVLVSGVPRGDQGALTWLADKINRKLDVSSWRSFIAVARRRIRMQASG